MPVYLRLFYFKQLLIAKEEEKKQYDKASKQSSGKVGPPPFKAKS